MRVLIISIFIFCSLTLEANDKADETTFLEAYKSYENAVASGNLEEARKYANNTLRLSRSAFGNIHKNTAQAALNLAELSSTNRQQKTLYKFALSTSEQLYGKNSIKLLDPIIGLAQAIAKSGEKTPAITLLKRAEKISAKSLDRNSLSYADVNMRIGQIYLTYVTSRKGKKHFAQAKKVFQKLSNDDGQLGAAQADFWIGKQYLAEKNNIKATKSLLASLKVFEVLDPGSPITMSNHAFLIQAYEERGKRDEATKHCQAIGAMRPLAPNQDYLPVYYTRPNYPRNANVAGIEGFAIVSLTIDKEGFVANTKVVANSGTNVFDKAAIAAAKKFRYAPRHVDGTPVATNNVRYKFNFKLTN